MVTLNDSHLKALSRSVYFVESGITNSMTPKMRDYIKKDIILINEVHTFVMRSIIEPGLPMSLDLETVPYDGEGHGHED